MRGTGTQIGPQKWKFRKDRSKTKIINPTLFQSFCDQLRELFVAWTDHHRKVETHGLQETHVSKQELVRVLYRIGLNLQRVFIFLPTTFLGEKWK